VKRFLVLALVACKAPVTHLPVGTRVAMAELYEHRSDVTGFVAAELAAKRYAHAFYALELAKTRPYSEEALVARDRNGPQLAIGDLRPVFENLMAAAETDPTRGVVLVGTGGVTATQPASTDAAFWQHMKQFEARTLPLNESTVGIPYDFAARRGYGVSTAEETGRLLAPEEAFVSYFVHRDSITVFVVARGKLHVEPIVARASELRDRVQKFVALVRTPPASGTDRAWLAEAQQLHAILIAPIEKHLVRATGLFISPHGFLANLPFGLLARGEVTLLEHKRVTYVPSASIYRQLLARPILNTTPRLLAIGNAIYPSGVASLEFAEKEALAVSELFPGGRLLRGKHATESRVLSELRTFNILHFATHGVLLGKAVPGASSLLVSADDTHDGFLAAAEIAALDLSHVHIAVLSACETSVSDRDARSNDLGSITNAFLTAGAPTVLGTLWQVDDAATTRLMLDFYQQFLEVGAGEALRRAQLALRKDPRHAHPYYWGAFALFGWDK
jgi:CHAT domain-containing protein